MIRRCVYLSKLCVNFGRLREFTVNHCGVWSLNNPCESFSYGNDNKIIFNKITPNCHTSALCIRLVVRQCIRYPNPSLQFQREFNGLQRIQAESRTGIGPALTNIYLVSLAASAQGRKLAMKTPPLSSSSSVKRRISVPQGSYVKYFSSTSAPSTTFSFAVNVRRSLHTK